MRKSCVVLAAILMASGLQAEPRPLSIEPIETINTPPMTGRFIDPDGFRQAAFVLSVQDERRLGGTGDLIQVQGVLPEPVYGIFRQHDRYLDPYSGELLGFYLDEIGQAQVIARSGERNTLRIAYASREVRSGDRLLPSSRVPVLASVIDDEWR